MKGKENLPDKLVPLEKARIVLEKLRQSGKKIVFTNGCFDLIHVGHIKILFEARSLGDYLVVGLNSDISIKKFKSKQRPILSQEERATILSAISCVDMIILFDEETPLKLIQQISPHILVKGDEYPLESIAGAREILSSGGQVIRVKMLPGMSTTSIIERILKTYNSDN